MDLEQEIQNIKERNQKVEVDKAWERSYIRRLFIAAMTYAIALVWLLMIHDSVPLLKAFIPAIGYILSTLSLPFVKNWWAKNK